MSVRTMSLVFEATIPDLEYQKDGENRKAKASTCKLVLLAYADHANDEGESAYPGYSRLEIKTALSRQGISDTLEAITQNGLMVLTGKSKTRKTNVYRVDLERLRSLVKPPDYHEKERVKPLDQQESSHLTDMSQATGLNPSLSILKPSLGAGAPRDPSSKETPEENPQALSPEKVLSPEEKTRKRMEDSLALFRRMPAIQPLIRAFIDASGIFPSKGDVSGWIKGAKELSAGGITPRDIKDAVEHLRKDGRSIYDLFSVKKVATSKHAENYRAGLKRQKELSEQTRQRKEREDHDRNCVLPPSDLFRQLKERCV